MTGQAGPKPHVRAQAAGKLRWSLSTRIFLAFAVVIACTGVASLYAIASVASLRHELTFLRGRALPLLDQLRQSTSALRAFDEALQRAAPQDLDWVVRLLPNARPYQRVEQILSRSRQLALRSDPPGVARLVARQPAALPVLEAELAALRSTTEARDRVSKDPELAKASGPLGALKDDAAVYDTLAASLQRSIADRRLDDAARLVVELRRMIRHVHTGLERAERDFEQVLADRFDEAERAESNLVWVVVATAGLSLLVSLVMLLLSVVALRPLAVLTAVVRRFAGGERQVRATTTGASEIATLAEEWNRMADALADREAQLFAQREDLDRAERLAALGHVAARMAHEVRNPLSSIGLNAEMLDEELQQPGELNRAEARELLAAMIAEIDRLRVLTEGYLDRARPAAGAHTPIQPATLVRELTEFLTPELQRRQIRVVLDLDEAATIEGDPATMRQALWNLMRNAWEAAGDRPGAGTIWLQVRSVQRQDQPGVEIAVEDSGPGVPEPLRDRIFEPFLTSKERGTGIGLAVVREIMRQHRGVADLQPAQHGSGARLVLWVPQAVR